MEKLYKIFPKRKQRQLNLYNPCDVDQVTYNYKFYQFDSECLLETSLDDSSRQDNFLCGLKLVETDSESSSIHSFSPRQKTESQSKGKIKSGRNTYVINISNCKYFHIGPQKTINIDKRQLAEQPCTDDNTTVDLEKLLDCQEKLTEKCITIISLNLHDQWKEFFKYLGVDDSQLEMLELRNDNHKALIVYDALQEYMNFFPYTSIGFVIHIFNELQQLKLIERLAKELNVDCN